MPIKNSIFYFTRETLKADDKFSELDSKLCYYHEMLYFVKELSTDMSDILSLSNLYLEMLNVSKPVYKFILHKKYDLNVVKKNLDLKSPLKAEGILSSYYEKQNLQIEKDNRNLLIQHIIDDFRLTFNPLVNNSLDDVQELVELNKNFLNNIEEKLDKLKLSSFTDYDSRNLTDDFEQDYPDPFSFLENLKLNNENLIKSKKITLFDRIIRFIK